MKLRILLVLAVGAFSACGDADGGIEETSIPDAEVSSEVDATSAETSEEIAAETVEETTAETRQDATETIEDVVETSDDTAPDVVPDAQDDTADTDTSEPECLVDADCQLLGIIVAPNNCTAALCVEGQCTTGPRDCDDGDPCTVDSCDPFEGCVQVAATVEVGNGRYTFCAGPLSEGDASAACFLRGGTLAHVDGDNAAALEPLLTSAAVDSAWVARSSAVLCPIPKRIIAQPCQTLQASADGVCTQVVDCIDPLPFICALLCDDGDPCTVDFIDETGECASRTDFCDDGDACTFDACSAELGCTHQNPRGQCIDTNPCTTDTCNKETGECSNVPVRKPWDATHELLQCPGGDTWSESRTWCGVNGGVLANPTTEDQRTTLGAFALDAGTLWAPFQKTGDAWAWVDGAGSGEPPWCFAEPSGADACGEWSEGSCASDASCVETRAFACAIDTSIP